MLSLDIERNIIEFECIFWKALKRSLTLFSTSGLSEIWEILLTQDLLAKSRAKLKFFLTYITMPNQHHLTQLFLKMLNCYTLFYSLFFGLFLHVPEIFLPSFDIILCHNVNISWNTISLCHLSFEENTKVLWNKGLISANLKSCQ